MSSAYDVWFTDDAEAFLGRAGAVLEQDPVSGTVVSTMARRVADHGMPDGVPDWWFAVVSDPAGDIAGIAMRTAPFEPWPPYLLAMGDDAAEALADAVAARGAEVRGVSGLRPAADRFAATLATRSGRVVEVHLHHRLFELGTLVDPRPVPGRLRAVRPDKADLALAILERIDQQAMAAGRNGDRVEILLLTALAHKAAGNAPEAFAAWQFSGLLMSSVKGKGFPNLLPVTSTM